MKRCRFVFNTSETSFPIRTSIGPPLKGARCVFAASSTWPSINLSHFYVVPYRGSLYSAVIGGPRCAYLFATPLLESWRLCCLKPFIYFLEKAVLNWQGRFCTIRIYLRGLRRSLCDFSFFFFPNNDPKSVIPTRCLHCDFKETPRKGYPELLKSRQP